MVTFATDRPGGFDDAHLASLSKLLPVLALVSGNPGQEPAGANAAGDLCRVACRRAHSGRATRRGSGTTVRAAIMICDLRDFTGSPTTGRAMTSLIS